MDPEPISTFLNDYSVEFYIAIQIAILLLLFVSSAIISGTEVAFFSLSKTDLGKISESGTSKSDLVLVLLEKPKKLLATILITNNFVNIFIVLLFASIGAYFLEGVSGNIRLFIEVVLVTFLLLLFGEVLPKVYATRNSVRFAVSMSKPIAVISRIVSPLSYVLTSMTGFIEKKLSKKASSFSVEKLSQALELTSDEATTNDEKNILEGIVAFGNTETVQVMIPRIDICAISDETKFKDVLTIILEKGFSRNPVYHSNIDEIIGVIYTKDLLAHINKKEFNWQNLMRPPYFVPENKKLDDLLIDFQEKKNHLAIVVDEYGGTSGLVTLNDVIEEIVGDINDEFDTDDLLYSKLDDKNFVFEGKTSLKDYYRVLDIDSDDFEENKGESETLAGFILEISGKFPKKGEKVSFKGFLFTMESVDRRRIKRVKVTIQDVEN